MFGGWDRMNVDQELLEAGIEVVKELSKNHEVKLPDTSFRVVATQMLKQDKLGDDDWCVKKLLSEREIFRKKLEYSKQKKYFPFVNVGLSAFRWIVKNYGYWTLKIMREKLEHPMDAHRLWAIQFAATMKAIGEEECEQTDNLYHLVVNSVSWNEMRKERKAWVDYIKSVKKEKIVH